MCSTVCCARGTVTCDKTRQARRPLKVVRKVFCDVQHTIQVRERPHRRRRARRSWSGEHELQANSPTRKFNVCLIANCRLTCLPLYHFVRYSFPPLSHSRAKEEQCAQKATSAAVAHKPRTPVERVLRSKLEERSATPLSFLCHRRSFMTAQVAVSRCRHVRPDTTTRHRTTLGRQRGPLFGG